MSWTLAIWLIIGVWSAVWYSNIIKRNYTPEEIKKTPVFLHLCYIAILGYVGFVMVYCLKAELEPDNEYE